MNPLAEMLIVGTFWFWVLILAECAFLIWCLEYEKYIVAPVTLVVLGVLLILFGTGVRDIGEWMWNNKVWTGIYAGLYVLFGAVYAVAKWLMFVYDMREVNRDVKRGWLADWKQTAQLLGEQVAGYKEVLAQQKTELERLNRELGLAKTHIDRDKINQTEYKVNQVTNTISQYEQKLAADEPLVAIWQGSNGVMTAELLPVWKEYEKTQYHRDWFGRSNPIVKPEPEDFKARIISWVGYWPVSLFWTIVNDPLRRIGRAVYNFIARLLRRISDVAWKDEDNVVG